MGTYWPILRDKVRYLYDRGVRMMEAQAVPKPNGQIRVYWDAWGPDGLLADWKELGLDEALGEVASKITWGRNVAAVRLYIYPRGYRLERRNWGEDWELEGEWGTSGKEPIRPRHQFWRPLRERLQHLVANYHTWYHHNAPEEWREAFGPEPTPENVFELGKAMEEWSILEEPLVPRLLQEILGKEG